jgi:hypothetical protein
MGQDTGKQRGYHIEHGSFCNISWEHWVVGKCMRKLSNMFENLERLFQEVNIRGRTGRPGSKNNTLG